MVSVKKRPVIGVAVPNLNQGKFLEEALVSILSQKDVDVKISLVDAGSTDNSVELINKYKRHFVYWRSHPDRGQAAAINEGIAQINGADYVGWLNADDTLLEHSLKKMADILEEDPEAAVVYGKGYIIDEKSQVISSYPTDRHSSKTFSRSCTICQPASLIKYSAWERVRGLKQEFQMCMDYDLWWRISKVGKLVYLEDFMACSRDHNATKTRTFKSQNIDEAITLIKKHYGYVPWNWFIGKSSIIMDNIITQMGFLPYACNKTLSRILALGFYLYNNVRRVEKGIENRN